MPGPEKRGGAGGELRGYRGGHRRGGYYLRGHDAYAPQCGGPRHRGAGGAGRGGEGPEGDDHLQRGEYGGRADRFFGGRRLRHRYRARAGAGAGQGPVRAAGRDLRPAGGDRHDPLSGLYHQRCGDGILRPRRGIGCGEKYSGGRGRQSVHSERARYRNLFHPDHAPDSGKHGMRPLQGGRLPDVRAGQTGFPVPGL